MSEVCANASDVYESLRAQKELEGLEKHCEKLLSGEIVAEGSEFTNVVVNMTEVCQELVDELEDNDGSSVSTSILMFTKFKK